MTLSAQERQRRWRHRAIHAPDGLLLTRVQVFIDAQTAAALDRLVARTGKSKRALIEQAVRAMDAA